MVAMETFDPNWECLRVNLRERDSYKAQEIVEEQRCHDDEFRLTCRELDTHIAILEAWYTSLENYYRNDTLTHANLIKTQNDSELDKVYIYSSPKHNGVFELTNHTFENYTNVNNSFEFDSRIESVNETIESVDMSVDFVNVTCSAVSFARSYASWREGDKRRRMRSRDLSYNLRAPLSYRLNEHYPLKLSRVSSQGRVRETPGSVDRAPVHCLAGI
ncbi:unnamed protein product [Pieris macdunnoughi]|uniref:Uncharacterized protein n=1 Tax=Pieris macdunnoughi TaxID=345717 RepID=A0A821TDP3_9NEOP|nr:unnamed protein product [Pieris macdunnoughi]